ncbi:MAG: HAD family hydrolase [Microcystaceae cyanobacterium]
MNKKNCVFFLSLILSILCLGGIFNCPSAAALGDPLPSWNQGTNKAEIMAFVKKITNPNNPNFVPEKDRFAVFDNDGTLWSERPAYFQALFIQENRSSESQVKLSQLPKSTQKEVDTNGDDIIDSPEIRAILKEMAVFEGMSTEAYIALANDFVYNSNQPDFNVPYIKLIYKPVIELVNYLKDNGFKVYICSGGGVDFVRSFAEDAYGIPPQEVIGSAIKTKFDMEFGGKVIRQAFLGQYNDKFGKPVGIERHIGKRPIMAVGNSGGDFQMFQYTDVGVDNSLIVLINHDDCVREYEYNNIPNETEDGEPKNISLDEAQKRDNWKVISMKNDFNTIFPETLPTRDNLTCSN